MNKTTRYSQERRENAVQMVFEHLGDTISVGSDGFECGEVLLYGREIAEVGALGVA